MHSIKLGNANGAPPVSFRSALRMFFAAVRVLPVLCLGAARSYCTGFEPVTGDPLDQVQIASLPAAVYESSCLACHGESGAGAPAEQVGFDVPLPDFTDCNFASREPDSDWLTVVQYGGPVRSFSRMMSSFGNALTEEEIKLSLEHIRTFCPDPAWPRGELNMPRPLYTTKAFPEDEIVVDTMWDTTDGAESVSSRFYYERRFGKRSQFEVILPYTWQETAHGWEHGFDDLGFGLKSALLHDWKKGYILSPGVEVFLPTGDDERGIGRGTTFIEPYLAYGQLLGSGWFVQAQAGGGLPVDGSKAQEEVFARATLGFTVAEKGYGRAWSPMAEILVADTLRDGAPAAWDLAPQLQVTLSRRQHVRLGTGVRIPLNNTRQRDIQFGVYLLWDWFDGGFFEGWR